MAHSLPLGQAQPAVTVIGCDLVHDAVIRVGAGSVHGVTELQAAAEGMAIVEHVVADEAGAGRLLEAQGPTAVGGLVDGVVIDPVPARPFRPVDLEQDDARRVVGEQQVVADD
jgi:hypothetical protein